MVAAVSPSVIALLIGLAVGGVASLVIPIVSRRRNLDRARTAGAEWVGLANFDGLDAQQAPVVAEALANVGPFYGSFFSPVARSQRPVGGLLYVFAEELHWQPRLWLGRGHAAGWSLPRSDVDSVEVARMPPPALRSYRATIHTHRGEIRFTLVDHKGLRRALDHPPDP